MFPSREYMTRFFPILEKYPFLLGFCWMIRNWRFFRRICANKCKKAGFRLRVRLLDIQQKVKGMIRRKSEEAIGEPEEASEDVIPQAEEGGLPDYTAEEERELLSRDAREAVGAQGRDTGEENRTQETDAEERGDSRNEDAEEETANIEQTEGDRDV